MFWALVLSVSTPEAKSFCLEIFEEGSSYKGLFTKKVASYKVTSLRPKEMKEIAGVKRFLKVVSIKTVPGEIVTERDLFKDGVSDLIVGIDSEGNTRGHAYLVIKFPNGKQVRVDGRLFRQGYDLTKEDDLWKISNGAFIRLRNIDPYHMEKLLDFINNRDQRSEVKNWTCVGVACQFLFEIAELISGPEGRRPWFPSTLLRHVARYGFRDVYGNQIPVEVYTLNESPDFFWNRLPKHRSVLEFIWSMVKTLGDKGTWGSFGRNMGELDVPNRRADEKDQP
jgi:hypothetical protein